MPGHYRLLVVLALLLTLLLACGPIKKASISETRAPVSQEAADRLAQKLESSVNKDDGTFSLEFTDVELTSYFVLELSQPAARAVEIPLQDFQAQFTDGQMILWGKLTNVLPFDLNARVAASARVENGRLDVNFSEAQVGVVSLSRLLLEGLSRVVTETIVESPLHLEEAVEITDIAIGQGVMRLDGRVVKSGE